MTAGRSVDSADPATWAMRAKLRAVDAALVELLAARFELVARLWAHKAAVGIRLEDPVREEETIRSLCSEAGRRGLDPRFVDALFRTVIAEGKRAARTRGHRQEGIPSTPPVVLRPAREPLRALQDPPELARRPGRARLPAPGGSSPEEPPSPGAARSPISGATEPG